MVLFNIDYFEFFEVLIFFAVAAVAAAGSALEVQRLALEVVCPEL